MKQNKTMKIFTMILIIVFLVTSFGTGFLVLFGPSGNIDNPNEQEIIENIKQAQEKEFNFDTILSGSNLTGDSIGTGSN